MAFWRLLSRGTLHLDSERAPRRGALPAARNGSRATPTNTVRLVAANFGGVATKKAIVDYGQPTGTEKWYHNVQGPFRRPIVAVPFDVP